MPKPYTPDQIFGALEQSIAWKEPIDEPRLEGEVALDARDDGEALRQLAHLRRLLQDRCGIEAAEVVRISSAIKAIWSSIDAWSRRRPQESVATLTYSLSSQGLTLTVHDEAGWLPGALADGSLVLPADLFDQVTGDDSGRSLTLVKRCKPAEGRE